jgi:secondary thiamine-phosphate synthase enzyme
MAVYTDTVNVSTGGAVEFIDITADLEALVAKSGLSDGIMVVFCPGSTGAISTMEFEPGLKQDIPNVLEKIAPIHHDWYHHQTWHDNNGSSHIRSFLIGPSLSIPIVNGRLTLGTWQQVVFVELDTRKRSRDLVVQIVGE